MSLLTPWARAKAKLNAAQNTAYGEAYHGYWQQDLYSLNENFGSATDLKALSAAVHAQGMYLMVDVVVNHFAWSGNSSTVNYHDFTPFNGPSYFHSYCPITSYDYCCNQTGVEDVRNPCHPCRDLLTCR